jgi:hypothetical protein
MGKFRSWISRLEKRAGRNSFILKDGSSYSYDFDEVCGELFAHCVTVLVSEDDEEASVEAPPILQAIRNARDPIAAMEPFRPESRDGAGAFLDPVVLLSEESQEIPP